MRQNRLYNDYHSVIIAKFPRWDLLLETRKLVEDDGGQI